MTITVSTADQRSVKALAILAAADRWQRGHTKDGRSFFAIPGSEPNLFHMTDTRECSCPDFRHRGEACKHVLAVRLWVARSQGLAPGGAAHLAVKRAAGDWPAEVAARAAEYHSIFGRDE